MEQTEVIVRALAALRPWVEDPADVKYELGGHRCPLCDVPTGGVLRGRDETWLDYPPNHYDDCPWRQAAEWVTPRVDLAP